MTSQITELMLNLNLGPDTDDEELAEVTQQLRSELLEMDLQSVNLVSEGETPSQSKSGDLIAWGNLLLTLSASGGVITTLITVLQGWVARHERRSLILEIDGDKLEIKGISAKSQKELISAWLDRNSNKLKTND